MAEPAHTMILTVGHSTRDAADFGALLRTHGVTLLADIRTVPRSRHNPQFDRDTLPRTLATVGISYLHLPALGGLRRPRAGSPNDSWRNDSFRGFADYMQTAEFAAALDALVALAVDARVAIMCAEAVPWRCHRSLVADALVARGVAVAHVTSSSAPKAHRLTPFARVEGTRVTYPARQQRLDFGGAGRDGPGGAGPEAASRPPLSRARRGRRADPAARR